MIDQILQAVKGLAEDYAAPFTEIDNGATPAGAGLAIYPGPGTQTDSHFDRGASYSVPFVLNGKHGDLGTLLPAMSTIHAGLSRLKEYPKTDDWQILSIESATPPNYLGREESSSMWMYGSILSVRFYTKGV